jgi:hypothetical protein
MLQLGIREKYRAAVDAEHHDMPPLVRHEHMGRAGRPKILIDERALEWAAGHATTSAIGRYFGVSRQTIQNRLIAMGLREPQEPPFVRIHLPSETCGMLLVSHEKDLLIFLCTGPEAPSHTAETPSGTFQYVQVNSYTRPISQWSDDELDSAILEHRTQFPRAGISMIHGHLRSLGQNVPQERISESLRRIDPVGRVFQRHIIERRAYSVAGPNALWHHDGQHGEI